MRRNTKINRVMWAYVSPTGEFKKHTVRATRREVIEMFTTISWNTMRKDGGKIIKVRVQEI